jgi:quinohemoprotein ethanol dehydrogenase
VPTIDASNALVIDPTFTGRHPGQGNLAIKQSFSSAVAADAMPAVFHDFSPPLGADLSMRAVLRAYDPNRRKIVWEAEGVDWWSHAGVLATGGGLVMQGGVDGHFRVFDAENGRVLKDIDTGASIMAAPMSYKIRGIQYVAVMAAWGGGDWLIWDRRMAAYRYGNLGRILVFKLDGAKPRLPPALPDVGPIPTPPSEAQDPDSVGRGAALFPRNCGVCHMNNGRSGTPDLLRMSQATHLAFNRIVLGGAYVSAGMPRWDDLLTPAQVQDIHSYLIDAAQKAYAHPRAK